MYKKVEQALNGANWYTGFMGSDGRYSYRREARLYLELVEIQEPSNSVQKAFKRGVRTIDLLSGVEDGE